jgi:hypothetical protein
LLFSSNSEIAWLQYFLLSREIFSEISRMEHKGRSGGTDVLVLQVGQNFNAEIMSFDEGMMGIDVGAHARSPGFSFSISSRRRGDSRIATTAR